jgi:hypothetical protein
MMRKSNLSRRQSRLFPLFVGRGRPLLATAVLLSLLFLFLRPAPDAEARQAVNASWQNARAANGYQFNANIVQTTIPLPMMGNIGRSGKEYAFHLEGSADFPNQTLELALWSGGGTVADRGSATQMRVAGDKAYALDPDQTWREIPNFTGAFAPDGDFLAFLAAAKNISNQGYESRAGVGFTRYTYELDGPSFAAYARDQLQTQLARQGKLPPGISLELSEQYRQMTGVGELWVRDDGLPLRQIIVADFPAMADQDYRTEARITVDFSYPQLLAGENGRFWASVTGWRQTWSTGLAALSGRLPDLTTTALAAAFALLLCALLIRFSRSRYVYTAVTTFMIVSLVGGPLLHAQTAAAFAAEQRQTAQTQTREQESYQVQERVQEQLTAVHWGAEQTNFENLSTLSEAAALCTDPLDSDSDGLTDCEEKLLGTNPHNPDTDGDGLTDYQEVNGFLFNGQRWYSDPFEVSTMKDGVGDSYRCAPDQFPNNCPDSDGDGVPDMFDLDIDGDGVPNQLDLSPFRRSEEIFSQNNPLQLTVNDLEANRHVYVEFQLRPTNPNHLWYAFNVLDWADGDRAGQIQRDSDYRDANGNRIKTFFDVCIQQGRPDCLMSPDSNGDIKLVPMLEIEIPGSSPLLPGSQELEKFGVFVTQGANGNRFAYAPLQLVTDNRTGARTAFYGKMLYQTPWNSGAWGGAHQARLVWAVQMLTDECQESEGGTCVSYEADGVSKHNRLIVAATYYEDFYLTGLNVRENRGTEYAVIYEDPNVDTDFHLDTALIPASIGLDSTFLSNRDCDTTNAAGGCVGDGKPDVTVNGRFQNAPTIADRLDHTRNGNLTEQQRWGIPRMLRVVNQSYPHRDLAIVSVGSVAGVNILNSHFTPHWSVTEPITPTLLYAYEDNFRALNLAPESVTPVPVGDQMVRGMDWNGRALTVNLRATVAQTTAGMNWASYRYNGATWNAIEATAYLTELDRRYGDAIDPLDSPESAEGKTAANQLYYLMLYNGASSLVRAGDAPIQNPAKFQTDAQQTDLLKIGLQANALVVKNLVVKQLDLYLRVGAKEVYEYLGVLKGLTLKENAIGQGGLIMKARQQAIKTGGLHPKWGTVGYGVATVALLVVINLSLSGVVDIPLPGLATPAVLELAGTDTGSNDLNQALGIGMQILVGAALFYILFLRTAKEVYEVYKAVRASGQMPGALNRTATILAANSELIGQTKWFQRAGLVFELGIIWGIALYQIFSAGLEPGSIGFNMVIAGAVAATLVAILMFALGMTVIGTLIIALITFVDLFLRVLCASGIGGACFGIMETVTNAIASTFYSVRSYVNFNHQGPGRPSRSRQNRRPAHGSRQPQRRAARRQPTALHVPKS